MKESDTMRYLIWGLGQRLNRFIDRLDLNEVAAFIDKKAEMLPEDYFGKKVISPDEISEYEYDYIVIATSKYRTEVMRELLFNYSVPSGKIMDLEELVPELCEDVRRRRIMRLSEMVMHYDRQAYKCIIQDPGKYYGGLESKIRKSLEDIENDSTIYVVSHKSFCSLSDNLYKTIWVGEAAKENKSGVCDGNGENISHWNHLINECTALYWIWKNDSSSDYIGLNHYRRYFSSPYDDAKPLEKWEISLILKECDVIVAKAISLDDTVMGKMKEEICKEALDNSFTVLNEIFDGKPEEERQCFNKFISNNIIYPCQMFIMRRELLSEYCSWLFPILFEMIDRVKISEDWDGYSKRVIGFWAERMLTVWLLVTGYRIEELPIFLTDKEGPYGKNV